MVVIGMFLLGAITYFLDVSFLKNFGLNPIFPVLTLAYFVTISSKDKSYWSLVMGLILGLLFDSARPDGLPIYLILFASIYLVNRYLVAGVLSYGQGKQALAIMILAAILLLLADYQTLLNNISISKFYIFEVIMNMTALIVVYFGFQLFLRRFFDSFEKYLAERFR